MVNVGSVPPLLTPPLHHSTALLSGSTSVLNHNDPSDSTERFYDHITTQGVKSTLLLIHSAQESEGSFDASLGLGYYFLHLLASVFLHLIEMTYEVVKSLPNCILMGIDRSRKPVSSLGQLCFSSSKGTPSCNFGFCEPVASKKWCFLVGYRVELWVSVAQTFKG